MTGDEEKYNAKPELENFVRDNMEALEELIRKEKESAEYTYRRSKDRVRNRVDKTKRDARSSARQTFGAFMDPKVQEHFMTAGFEFIMGVNNLIRALPHTPFEENDYRDDYYYDDDEEEEEVYQKPKKRSSPRSIEIIASEDEEDKSEGRSRKRSPAREE